VNLNFMKKHIKPLGIEYLPEIADVIRRSFASVARDFNLTKENCPTFTGFITDKKLSDELQDGYIPFGYFSDGILVGVVLIQDRSEGIYKMKHLAVLPEYRHFGYGKSLLDFCKEKVMSLGGNKITIGIIEENTVLKEWYVKNGFFHIGTEKYKNLPFTVGYMEWEVC